MVLGYFYLDLIAIAFPLNRDTLDAMQWLAVGGCMRVSTPSIPPIKINIGNFILPNF